MQTKIWALLGLGPSSSCRVRISQPTRLVSPKKGSCAVFPARRDELRLDLAGLDADASRTREFEPSRSPPYKKTPSSVGAFLCGPPGEIRTPDTQVRSLVLYPAELRAEARSLGFPPKKVKQMSKQAGKTHHNSVSRRPAARRKTLGETLKVISHQCGWEPGGKTCRARSWLC
jgi:hypothetical protein